MKKYLISIFLISIFIFCTRYFVFTKHTKKTNPLFYTYNAPIYLVREKIINQFSNSKFHGLDFVEGYNPSERNINNIRDYENHNHFFINWFGWFSSGEESEIYYNYWGKLKLIPRYHIILDSISGRQTKITIQSFPKVEAGTNFSLNHFFPYTTSRKVSVKPSTLEEYEIIKLIGEQLGEKNMPAIQHNL